MANSVGGGRADGLRRLGRERQALLRIAALATDGSEPNEVFEAVAAEAAAWVDAAGASLIRFDGEHAYTVVGSCAGPAPSGTRITLGPNAHGVIAEVLRTGGAPPVCGGVEAETVPGAYDGPRGVGIPLIVDNRLWGVLEVTTGGPPPSGGTVTRLQDFARLVTAAVANAEARGDLQALVDERAALRRVHEVAGRGGTGADVLAAIAAEGSAWLDGLSTALSRLEHDGTSAVVAFTPGSLPTESDQANVDDVIAAVVRSAAPARSDDVHFAGRVAGRPGNQRQARACVGVPVLVGTRIWGVFVAIAPAGAMPPQAERRLARFADAITPTILSAQARTQLAEEQFALRRVAELVARGAGGTEVFAMVVTEASRLTLGADVTLARWEDTQHLRVVAAHGAHSLRTGTLLDTECGAPSDENSIVAPIRLGGASWGVLGATSATNSFPAGTEHRLHQFADLAAAALANAQARADIQALADEQAALSRVAALVVAGAALDEVFSAVAAEASGLVGNAPAVLVRLASDAGFIVVAAANSNVPQGFRGQPQHATVLTDLIRTGGPARVQSFEDTPWADAAPRLEIGPTVAVPITVEGRPWGALIVTGWQWPLPDHIEKRLVKIAELAGAAIANSENKAKLTASRARVVATADETRRRLQRDVHDSAQQRLVHTVLTLKLARQSIAAGRPPNALVDEALLNAERASSDLRDIVRGILPAALTRGGLSLGLESLLSGMALPVDLHVTAPRCATDTEQTAYLIVAEALANVTEHAHADRAAVSVTLEGNALVVEVRDDGIGGADPAHGTGLIGLADRAEAVDGTFRITSPPGGGTTLLVRLPIHEPPHPHR